MSPSPIPAESVEAVATASPAVADEMQILLRDAKRDFQNKDFPASLQKLEQAEALKPDQAEVINFRGAIYAETGRFEEAVKVYERALSLDPSSFWPAFNIGEVAFIQKKYGEARAQFAKTLEKICLLYTSDAADE